MKMYDNQRNLPKLPLPSLEDTCGKLLQWSRPFLSREDYESSKAAIDTFQSSEGDGPLLQKRLQEIRDQKETLNWLEPFWYDSYLKNRLPLPINSNVAFVLEKRNDLKKLSQAEFATSLLTSLFEYNRILVSEDMEIDRQGTAALCMSQYKTLLGTARIPGGTRDILKTVENPMHVVLIANGRYYLMPAPDENNESLNSSAICSAIDRILVSSSPGNENAVGNLTTLDRTAWANLRNYLKEIDSANAESLDAIETALAIIVLDQTEYISDSVMFKGMLCGTPNNRWYDKSLQAILSKDGHFAINYEHSGVDGTTLGNLVRYLHKNMKTYEAEKEQIPARLPKELVFKLDASLENEILRAQEKSLKAYKDLSIEVLPFEKFGKNRIKKLKISPDSFIQIAFQLAQQKTFGKVGNTYEAVMTKQFLHGRTEAMRPVTTESLTFVGNPTSENLMEASNKHIERIIECKNGYGIDRHLFGLMKMHEKIFPEKALPAIFHSPSYKAITRNFFSTSTSNSNDLLYAGYGPAMDEGYGLRYLIYDDQIHFVLSSMVQNTDSLLRLKNHLKEALIEMASIIPAE